MLSTSFEWMMRRYAKSYAFIENVRSNVLVLNLHNIFSFLLLNNEKQIWEIERNLLPMFDFKQFYCLHSYFVSFVNNINLSLSHKCNWCFRSFFLPCILECLFGLAQKKKHVWYSIYSYNLSSNGSSSNQFSYFNERKQKYQYSFEGKRNKIFKIAHIWR